MYRGRDQDLPHGKKKCKKEKWLYGEALQIAVKRREAKSKGEHQRLSVDLLWNTGNMGAFMVVQMVKNPPAMQETQETWVRSLDGEDSLEEEMAPCSCLENPRDGGAWWATVYGVA